MSGGNIIGEILTVLGHLASCLCYVKSFTASATQVYLYMQQQLKLHYL